MNVYLCVKGRLDRPLTPLHKSFYKRFIYRKLKIMSTYDYFENDVTLIREKEDPRDVGRR